MRRGQLAVVELFAARRRRFEIVPGGAAGLRRGAVLLDRIVRLVLSRLGVRAGRDLILRCLARCAKPRRIGLRREPRFMMADRFARSLLGEVRALARLGRGEIARGPWRLPRGDGDFVGEIGCSLLADIERRSDADRGDRQSRAQVVGCTLCGITPATRMWMSLPTVYFAGVNA